MDDNESLELGLSLVESSAKDPSGYKRKETGLQIIVLGLAEVQARRIKNLSKITQILEERLLDEQLLEDLKLNEVMAYYKLAKESLDGAQQYIQSTLKGMDWTKLESSLYAMQARDESSSSNDITAIAKDALKKLIEAGRVDTNNFDDKDHN